MFLGNLEMIHWPVMRYCPQIFRAARRGSKECLGVKILSCCET